jgi:hypothetical protein
MGNVFDVDELFSIVHQTGTQWTPCTRRGESNKVPLAVSIFGESDEAGPASG